MIIKPEKMYLIFLEVWVRLLTERKHLGTSISQDKAGDIYGENRFFAC